MLHFIEFDTSLLPEDKVDIIVCGSGIAGLTTALTLKELGINPIVLTRGVGNTYYSQGGIACAIGKDDSSDIHFIDTMRAGRNLNDERAVKILVEESLFGVIKLEKWGVSFDKDTKGYLLTMEGGHTVPRVLKVKDYTGRAIYEALWKKIKEYSIRVIEGELEEILGENKIEGVIIYHNNSLKLLRTKVLVLATGGNAAIFRHTTNPSKSGGDAMGIAMRAGLRIRNPEFIQFHPTVFSGTNLLISEAVRGEGGVLINEKGERFVKELEPRDIVARAIYRKIKEGHKVFLDMRPVAEKVKIEKRFPTIYNFLRERGIDPYKEPVPVTPAAHYFIGGIDVDMFGRTQMEGLYAVGECACTGVHGANRLASNSLLEGIVFGIRAAHRIFINLPNYKFSEARRSNRKSKTLKCNLDFESLRNDLWNFMGVEREGSELKNLLKRISFFIEEGIHWEPTVENRKRYDLLLTVLASVYCAYRRNESRGVHFRRDFPYEKEEYKKDSYYDFACSLT